ncbi:cyclophilin-like protein [Cutaneotrichosporon oleaginosum]|uniref:Peptidyl-prolyl isomerase CWC27 n=1 Tax=Cutaneotrichosporon oleaginosum TaxID=879819 RepID=A0A0J1B570_9TREE|nr:cyclophilin-like protein [Cutaneotrichosporon oleaginosum]KLT42844.1 cyclophilin-like protein [Cutaneotrichosporon oleaginosum]
MSNLYSTEPTPTGKVIVDTTAGEIEIELWGKENPKAVRNFVQLAMEGYYDGVIFHRVVKGFIVQTGDPTGTGKAGESIYGEPFEDEIHSRLKFNRRGLVGMANNGKRHTNNSQWFITLDRADELNGKHTLFGRIQGPTYYNVLNIGNLDVDAEEKPLVPPKIKGIRIIENPFDDIVPRITAAEKRAQHQARLEAKAEMEKKEKRARAKKNTGLLSFGEAEELDAAAVTVKKKDMGRRDLVASSSSSKEKKSKKPMPDLSDEPTEVAEEQPKTKVERERKAVDLKAIREQHERERSGKSSSRKEDIERMQEDLRAMKKRMGQDSDTDSEDEEERRKRRRGPSALEQELSKYKHARGRAAREKWNAKDKRSKDDDLLRDLGMFSKKVMEAEVDEEPMDDDAGDGEAALEVDDDVGWLRHSLKFAHEISDETRRAEDEYEVSFRTWTESGARSLREQVIDPRAKARAVAAEEERANKAKKRRD